MTIKANSMAIDHEYECPICKINDQCAIWLHFPCGHTYCAYCPDFFSLEICRVCEMPFPHTLGGLQISINSNPSNVHVFMLIQALPILSYKGETNVLKNWIMRFQLDLNTPGYHAYVPLMGAVLGGQLETAEFLLTKGSLPDLSFGKLWDESFSPLMTAAQKGDEEMVELLCSNCANIDLMAGESKTFSLYLAAESGHTLCVNTLLEFGANVNQSNKDGITSLFIAAYNGHTKIVKLLNEKYFAKLNFCDNFGQSPLHMAISKNDAQMVKTLLQCNANANICDFHGQNPLFWCSKKASTKIDIVKMLLNHKANVNQKRDDGFTPLLFSCQFGNISFIKLNAKFGADVNYIAPNGAFPLLNAFNFCSDESSIHVCQILIDLGANVSMLSQTLKQINMYDENCEIIQKFRKREKLLKQQDLSVVPYVPEIKTLKKKHPCCQIQ